MVYGAHIFQLSVPISDFHTEYLKPLDVSPLEINVPCHRQYVIGSAKYYWQSDWHLSMICSNYLSMAFVFIKQLLFMHKQRCVKLAKFIVIQMAFCDFSRVLLVCDLNRTPIVMAKHGGPWVHFSGISTCERTSRDTVSHPQHPPLPTLCKIYLPVCVIVTNERLQPLTTTWYNSPVLSFPLLKMLTTFN